MKPFNFIQILLIIISHNTWSQSRSNITSLSSTNKNILDAYLDQSNGMSIRLLIDKGVQVVPKTGPYSELELTLYTQSILFENGYEYKFSEGEMLNDFRDNIIITIQKHTDDSKATLRRYKITNNTVVKIAERLLDFAETTAQILENGNCLLSDESENAGNELVLLGKDLKVITKLVTNKEEFLTCQIACNQDKIFIVLKETYSSSLSFLMFDALLGMPISSKEINSIREYPQKLICSNENIILYASGLLVGLNQNGDLLWQRKAILPTGEIYTLSNNCILAQTNNQLELISSGTGKTVWIKAINELFDANNANNIDIPTKSSDIYLTSAVAVGENSIALLLSQNNKRYLEPNYNAQLIFIDSEGRGYFKDSVGNLNYILKMFAKNNKVTIINDKTQIDYDNK
ncbi:MAG: hypothetical protein ACK5AS_07445 [Bacteroidota bacterium]|jgi:hypothetical protein